jgi:hypothetical protein
MDEYWIVTVVMMMWICISDMENTHLGFSHSSNLFGRDVEVLFKLGILNLTVINL